MVLYSTCPSREAAEGFSGEEPRPQAPPTLPLWDAVESILLTTAIAQICALCALCALSITLTVSTASTVQLDTDFKLSASTQNRAYKRLTWKRFKIIRAQDLDPAPGWRHVGSAPISLKIAEERVRFLGRRPYVVPRICVSPWAGGIELVYSPQVHAWNVLETRELARKRML